VNWSGLALEVQARLLVLALDKTTHESDIELTEHWDLMDPQIMAVLHAMTTDLNESLPAGRLYRDALGTLRRRHLLGLGAAPPRESDLRLVQKPKSLRLNLQEFVVISPSRFQT
jgi:hypothetical protein